MMQTRPTHFIDFEASGIAPDSYPIAIGIALPDSELYSLIRPVRYWTHWSYDAQDMHGIERSTLFRQGTPARKLANRLNRLFAGLTLCCDNPADCFWFDVLFEAAGVESRVGIQPLEAWVGREAASAIQLHLPSRKAHNAVQDARDMQAAFDHWQRRL
jgi:hypothetical protein